MALKTIAPQPSSGGTVTSVNVVGGTTGLTTSGGPITTAGTITVAGTLAVASGGTGVTTSTGSGSAVLSVSPTLAGTVTFTGLVNSTYAMRVLGTNTGGASRATIQSLLNLDNSAAAGFSWNYSGGGGETDWFINRGGGGTGGLNIYDFPNTTGNPTLIAAFTGAGALGIGTSSPTAQLDVQSTTAGVRFPNMTSTQKNAIASPQAGTVVFDTTMSKLSVYSGAAWQTITSV